MVLFLQVGALQVAMPHRQVLAAHLPLEAGGRAAWALAGLLQHSLPGKGCNQDAPIDLCTVDDLAFLPPGHLLELGCGAAGLLDDHQVGLRREALCPSSFQRGGAGDHNRRRPWSATRCQPLIG